VRGLPCVLDPLWCSLFLECYKKLLDCRFGIRRRSGLVAIAILLFKLPISSSLIRPPFSTSGYRAALCRTWALGGDVAGLTTLVALKGNQHCTLSAKDRPANSRSWSADPGSCRLGTLGRCVRPGHSSDIPLVP
jgi:hypothetical protein